MDRSRHPLGLWSQVRLLLWKHRLQSCRHWKVTLAEILVPLLGAATLLLLRQLVTETAVPEPTTWRTEVLSGGSRGMVASSLKRDSALVLYSPNSSLVDTIMAHVNDTLRRDGLRAKAVGMATEEDILQFHRTNIRYAKQHPFTIVFHLDPRATTLPFNLTLTIRPQTDARDKWNTHRAFPFLQTLKIRRKKNLYDKHSFLYTQFVVSQAIIQQWMRDASSSDAGADAKPEAEAVAGLGVSAWRMQRIPYPPHIDDLLTKVVQLELPSLIMLSYIISVVIICKNLVHEKETQVKETIKLMGMSVPAYWTAWLLQIFGYLLAASVSYSVLLNVSVAGRSPVLHHSDPWLLLVFFLVYSSAVVAFCCFVSTLVSTANVGAALGGTLFFVIFFPFYFLEKVYQDLSLWQKLASCLSLNLAMSCGVKTIGLYEGTGEGALWTNFMRPASVDDNFSLLHAMLMLVLDTLILSLLAWYLDNVMPGRYGLPRPWYFPLQSSCLRSTRRRMVTSTHDVTCANDSRYFEREPSDLPVGIRMEHLGKVFGQDKVAVKGTTLAMYEGQITVLLGHNGAGKTTTMSMLTGLMPPSFGTAYIDGYNIGSQKSGVRHSLGLCPQHNVLFDSLTVDEHLTFFATLKGCPGSEVPEVVSAMAKEVGLETKRAARAGSLSGGQKRKLSVGIALVGGSRVVILDEPTSGMDPGARRETWEVLQRNRVGRTILLTTHYMDEADVLGDRIAIMAEGVVKCCGTSLFLKKLYGAGYHLVVVKTPHCDVSALTAVVRRGITGAQLESRSGAELSYLLPEEEGAKFAGLFRALEENCHGLGVTSFGVTSTTLEEVFHRVGESGVTDEADDTETKSGSPGVVGEKSLWADGNIFRQTYDCDVAKSPASSNAWGFSEGATASAVLDAGHERLSGCRLHVSQCWAMLMKKALNTRRNRTMTAVQLTLPVIFTIAALTVDKVRLNTAVAPPLTLDLSMFDTTSSFVSPGVHPSPLSVAMATNYTALFPDRRHRVVHGVDRDLYPDLTDFYLAHAGRVGLHTYDKEVLIGADFEPAGCGTHPRLKKSVDKPSSTEPLRRSSSDTSSSFSAGTRQKKVVDGSSESHSEKSTIRSSAKPRLSKSSPTDTLPELFPSPVESASFSAEAPRRKESASRSSAETRVKKPYTKSSSSPPANASAESRLKTSYAGRPSSPEVRLETPAVAGSSSAAAVSAALGPSAPLAQAADSRGSNKENNYNYLGSLLRKLADNVNGTRFSSPVSSQGCKGRSPRVTATAWYSGQPLHAKPVALAYLLNAVARQVTGQPHHLTVINHPMAKDDEHAALDSVERNIRLGFFLGFSMLFGMSFLMASFSYFLIRERQTGAKHLQKVSGAGPWAFWLACLGWDLVNYLLPCLLLLLVFAAFQVEAFTGDGNLMLVIAILGMAGISVLPFVYLLQFFFVSPAAGFVALIVLFIVTGLFAMTVVTILRLPLLMLEHVAGPLDWFFIALFPHYSLGTAFSNVYLNSVSTGLCKGIGIQRSGSCRVIALLGGTNPCCRDACGAVCVRYEENYLSWEFPGIGRNLFFMGLQAVVYFALTLAVDFQLPQKLWYRCLGGWTAEDEMSLSQDWCIEADADEDSDVKEERERIRKQQHAEGGLLPAGVSRDTLVLRDLYKQYQGLVAVDHVTVGVREGECFGLLGQNGAGKTSTFRMLTGDLMLTAGDAVVASHSVRTDVRKAQSNMGYCPQFDALLDQMTGRETLTMYARLRGVPDSRVQRTVDDLIRLFMLSEHGDKATRSYSGGTKRKLSSAIALVGGPPLILLDEPTSGMDPGARRQLWNVLSEVRASGRTLVLTSHSMEECDALCTRIAIMVNGRFRCLGSPQHLKSKFGQGYTLTAKMALQPDGTFFLSQPLVSAISAKFPGTITFDDRQGYVQLQVPQTRLSEVFAAMERARSDLGVEAYSVHQSSLEQIFLTFTKAQLPPREAATSSFLGRCCSSEC